MEFDECGGGGCSGGGAMVFVVGWVGEHLLRLWLRKSLEEPHELFFILLPLSIQKIQRGNKRGMLKN
ncbi:hypothetical protein Dsin_024361, partial [Dipteronia sinensis]